MHLTSPFLVISSGQFFQQIQGRGSTSKITERWRRKKKKKKSRSQWSITMKQPQETIAENTTNIRKQERILIPTMFSHCTFSDAKVVAILCSLDCLRMCLSHRYFDQGLQKNLGSSEPNEENIPTFKKPTHGNQRKKKEKKRRRRIDPKHAPNSHLKPNPILGTKRYVSKKFLLQCFLASAEAILGTQRHFQIFPIDL